MQSEEPSPRCDFDDRPVSREEAFAELERLFADPEFHSTERNKRFLRFVVEEFMEGRGNALKAYSIAVDAFGRPPTFDPGTDPIVRIEATRLRASLSQYYENHRTHHGVRIDLPKGRYVPVFTWRAAVGESAEADQNSSATSEQPHRQPGDDTLPASASARLRPTALAKITAISIGVVAGLALGGLTLVDYLRAKPVFSDKPSLSIDLRLAGDDADSDAVGMRDSLMIALSDFQTVRITSPEITARAGEARDADISERSSARQSSFVAVLKYRADVSGNRSVWWQIVDAVDGEALRTGTESVSPDIFPSPEAVSRLVARLATRLAGARGIINDIETARELANPTLGNGCIVRSLLALKTVEPDALQSSRKCLEETLRYRPGDPDVQASLANVLLMIDPPDAPTALSATALELADQSAASAPYSDRSAAAQMMAQFRAGNIDQAISTGHRAMALNPNNGLISAKLANILFTVGRWSDGIALLSAADVAGSDSPYFEGQTALALDAYRRGDFDATLVNLQEIDGSRCYITNILKLAALGQLGREPEAKTAADSLKLLRAGFEKSFRSDMAMRHFEPTMISSLEVGLLKAGLKVE